MTSKQKEITTGFRAALRKSLKENGLVSEEPNITVKKKTRKKK